MLYILLGITYKDYHFNLMEVSMYLMTKSGSGYQVSNAVMGPNKDLPCLEAFRDGCDGEQWNKMCVAVYPDRLESFLDSKTFEKRDGKLVGINKHGNVTCQFYADQVRKGMILANTKGFRSTVITKVID